MIVKKENKYNFRIYEKSLFFIHFKENIIFKICEVSSNIDNYQTLKEYSDSSISKENKTIFFIQIMSLFNKNSLELDFFEKNTKEHTKC